MSPMSLQKSCSQGSGFISSLKTVKGSHCLYLQEVSQVQASPATPRNHGGDPIHRR